MLLGGIWVVVSSAVAIALQIAGLGMKSSRTVSRRTKHHLAEKDIPNIQLAHWLYWLGMFGSFRLPRMAMCHVLEWSRAGSDTLC